MALTNVQIIGDALRDINVISEVDEPSPEQGAYALRKLNQMMASWEGSDIALDYFPQTDTTENCPIPEWAELGVTAALSLVCAAKYGADVSKELAVVLDEAVSTLRGKLIRESLEKMSMLHLPRGTGHRRTGYDINTGS